MKVLPGLLLSTSMVSEPSMRRAANPERRVLLLVAFTTVSPPRAKWDNSFIM